MAAGFSPEKAELCATLVRIMMPFLPMISLAAVAMGALNAERKYTAPALASSMFNLVAIVGGMAVYAAGVLTAHGRHHLGGAGAGRRRRPAGDPGAAACGGLGFRPRFLPDLRLRDPGTRRDRDDDGAGDALGVAAVQVNVVVNTTFASLISDGAISWLSYAFRLMQLPIGVFGVAVGTTALTAALRGRGPGGHGGAASQPAARAAPGPVPDRPFDGRAGAARRADHPAHLPAREVFVRRDPARRRAR